MKRKSKIKEETNSTVYRRIRIASLTGCCLNCQRMGRRRQRSWKEHRKTKWRV
jgi:hypothetical protein